MAAAEDVSDQVNPVEWWKIHTGNLKNWAKASRLVILVNLSSAAAERAFSQPFLQQQRSSLEDYICNVTVELAISTYYYLFAMRIISEERGKKNIQIRKK